MKINNFFRQLFPGWSSSKAPPGNLNGNHSLKNKSGNIVDLEYQWINNEQLLREEGAVYGILGQGLDEKLLVIQNYFNKVTTSLEVKIKGEEKALTVLIDREKKFQKKLETAKSELDDFPIKPGKKPHHFWRSISGLLIYILIVGATFYVTFIWLLPEFMENTIWFSLAVFAFGALSLFGHFPVLLHHDQVVQTGDKRETWKLLLEEFGVPLVSTIFIISFGAPHHHWWHSIAMGLFLLFVFLFAGKWLLTSINTITPQWQIFQSNLNQDKDYKSNWNDIESTFRGAENTLKEIETSISEKQVLLATLRKDLANAQVECETRKSYFLSEYKLAENAQLRHSLFD